jgi:hypothetical protein
MVAQGMFGERKEIVSFAEQRGVTMDEDVLTYMELSLSYKYGGDFVQQSQKILQQHTTRNKQ